MKPLRQTNLVATALLLCAFGFSLPASAGVEACGNINVEASAACEVMVQGGCTVSCTPLSFQAACAVENFPMCQGECTGSASLNCTGQCQADCAVDCEVDPGNFDCEGSCTGDCTASCGADCEGRAQASCEAEADQAGCEAEAMGQCMAGCDANCQGQCSASCSGTPPQADCDAACEANCSGQCEAEATGECRLDCQGRLEVACATRLQGGCEAACETPDGALFCDGQYVDHGGNLEECVTALNAFLEENIEFQAQGNANCQGNQCQAQGNASASCAMATPASTGVGGIFGLAVACLGFAGLARRRAARRV